MGIIFIYAVFIISLTQTADASYQRNLTKYLFDDYDSGISPVCDGVSKRNNITLDIALRQIVELDEPMQIILLNLWIRMVWIDCRLVWDESQYDNINHVIVPMDRVWIPDITLYDSVNKESRDTSGFKADIYADGTIRYNYPSLTESRCKVDVKYFPFDEQKCQLIFGSWAYSGIDIDVDFKNPYGDLSSIDENIEWKILSFPAVRHELNYSCCPELYPDVTFYLELRRKPEYYVYNILMPCILISAIGVLGFILPVESGEKVAVGVTVLLSQAVFLLVVGEKLPASSETLPLIAIYFDFAMFLVCFSCVISVVVLNFHYTNGTSLSPCMRVVFLRYLAKIVCIRTKENENLKFTDQIITGNQLQAHIHSNSECPDSPDIRIKSRFPPIPNGKMLPPIRSEENDTSETVNNNDDELHVTDARQKHDRIHHVTDWQRVALVVDRIGMFIYIIAFSLGTIIFMSLFGSQ